MRFCIANRSRHSVPICLAVTALLATCLVYGPSVLSRCGDASLHVVGHLISRLHDFTLDPLVPTYPRCFSTF